MPVNILKITFRLWFFGCALVLAGCSNSLKPFTTDGCSSFPDGTLDQSTLWLSCCTEHDLAYWKGGTYDQRKQADEELRQCVRDVDEPEIAVLMLAGVRVGGTPFLPTSFRWGYGWPYPKFYGELTADENTQVNHYIKEHAVKLLTNTVK